MASDRRGAEDRRGGAGQTDRRNSGDRRTESGRRAAEEIKPTGKSTAAKKKKNSRTALASGKKTAGMLGWLLKKLALAFMLLCGVLTAGLFYLFMHSDFYLEKAGRRIRLGLEKAALDPASLTGRNARVFLHFKVHNELPFDLILQNLDFSMHLSGYTVAKGMQAIPKAQIKGNGDTIVPVACSVDSIMTRRGLQKAFVSEARSILHGLGGKQDISSRFTENLNGLVKIDGKAEYRLRIAGIEIPFTQKVLLEKNR
jgi:hypothetical protein